LADGIDPANKKQEDKRKVLRAVAGTFSALVEDWYAGWSKTVAVSTAGQMRAVIDSHLIPKLGNRVAADLEPHDLLAELRKIESNAGQDQAHRALRVCVSTLRHALALGYVKRNAALDIKGMLTPIKNEHYRSVTTPVEFGTLLHKLWEYTDLEKNAWPGGPTPYTAYALRTLPYLALRPGEVRNMRWDWLRDETLVIPAAQMKMRKEFATVMDSNVARFGAMLVFTGKDRR
jgi:integrase